MYVNTGTQKIGNMKKFWILGIVFWLTQVEMYGATRFDLPVGTPGRKEDKTGTAIPKFKDRDSYEHVIIKGS